MTGPAVARIVQARFERVPVGVQVGEQGEFHGGIRQPPPSWAHRLIATLRPVGAA